MNALTLRALSALPHETQAQIRAHQHIDDIDEIIQNAWLARLETRLETGSGGSLADRARSDSRRYTQDPAYYGRGLDGIADVAAETQPVRAKKKREITREVTADFGVGPRRARQIVAAQIDRAKMGDLFADDESGDDDGEDE